MHPCFHLCNNWYASSLSSELNPKSYLQSLGIPFHFYVRKESKQLECRDLTRPEKVKLFKNINISSHLPNSQENKTIQQIWEDFSAMSEDLKHDYKIDAVSNFTSKVKNWLRKSIVPHQTKDVTPYMHTPCSRVPKFLSSYGNTAYFTQQGMEKYNDIRSKNIFRSTKHLKTPTKRTSGCKNLKTPSKRDRLWQPGKNERRRDNTAHH